MVSEFFSRREISMSLPNDIYVRYHSFESWEDFKGTISKKKPHKIDIGAVFTAPVSLILIFYSFRLYLVLI